MANEAMAIQFSPESMKNFRDLLDETVRVTGRSMELQVKLNGRDYLKKVIKMTPMMKKKQPRWLLVPEHPNSEKKIPKKAKDLGDEFKPWYPRGRGFARSGWLVALIGLGLHGTGQEYKKGAGKWKQVGEFKNRLKRAIPEVELGNVVPFIETLNSLGGSSGEPHFFQKAFDKTVRHMEHRLTYFSRQIEKKWR